MVITASARNPVDADLWAAMGDLTVHAGDVEKGANAFKQALGLAPDNIRAALGLATFYAMGGHHDEARALFQQVLAGVDAAG